MSAHTKTTADTSAAARFNFIVTPTNSFDAAGACATELTAASVARCELGVASVF